MCLLSCVPLCVTPWTLTPAKLLCLRNFPARISEWSHISFFRHLPDPGIKPKESLGSPVLAGEFHHERHLGSPSQVVSISRFTWSQNACLCSTRPSMYLPLQIRLEFLSGTVGPIDAFDGSLHTVLRPSLIIG